MNYGTYTTIDTPCLAGQGAGIEPSEKQKELEKKAFDFLSGEFKKIGGEVYEKTNFHDFGEYTSFEVNYSYEVKEAERTLELYDIDEELSDEELDDWSKADKIVEEWQKKADIIETNYYERFKDSL